MPYIAKYRHDKAAAFSITCDDGFINQVANTTAILDPLGLKATFFIMPHDVEAKRDNIVSWAEVRALHAGGHEIGTHASIVNKLHEIDDELRDHIINGGFSLLKERAGIRSVCWANPGGSEMTSAVRAVIEENHFFLRKSTLLPDADVGGYGSVPGKREWTDEKGRRVLRQTIADKKWRIAVVHAIVEGWSPFKSKEEARTHFAWVAEQKNLWVAPMGTVGRYVWMRKAAELKIHKQAPGSIEFSVSCDLEPGEVFDMPLTVVVPEQAEAAAAVTADGQKLPVSPADGKILVEVPANGNRVTVTFDK